MGDEQFLPTELLVVGAATLTFVSMTALLLATIPI
jgi:hypothetical protein